MLSGGGEVWKFVLNKSLDEIEIEVGMGKGFENT